MIKLVFQFVVICNVIAIASVEIHEPQYCCGGTVDGSYRSYLVLFDTQLMQLLSIYLLLIFSFSGKFQMMTPRLFLVLPFCTAKDQRTTSNLKIINGKVVYHEIVETVC